MAQRFGAEGANLVVASVEQEVHEAAEKLGGSGTRVLPVQCDVTSSEAVRALYDAAEAEFGAIDVSVQNAGIITIAKIEDLTEQDWDATLDVNTKGAFLCCQEAIRRMRRSGKDEAARLENYRKVSERIAEQVPVVPLFETVQTFGAAKPLQWTPTANESLFLNRMKWAE